MSYASFLQLIHCGRIVVSSRPWFLDMTAKRMRVGIMGTAFGIKVECSARCPNTMTTANRRR